jgi:hypothetical protein
MQMQQRQLGCGGSPAYRPIPRDAEIWKVEIIGDWDDRLYGYNWWEGERSGEGYKINDAKRCGDFDNDASLGVYIC